MRSASIPRPVPRFGDVHNLYTEDMMPQAYHTPDGSSQKSISDACNSPKYFEMDASRTSSISAVNTNICMQQGRYST